MNKAYCPQCGAELVEVPRHSEWLNDFQYQAAKAGDWYCTQCPSNDRGWQPICYWWDHEIEERMQAECDSMMRT